MPEEEEDENGWGTGYLYRDPDYQPGDHPIDRDEVTWHHIWHHRPKSLKTSLKSQTQSKPGVWTRRENLPVNDLLDQIDPHL